MNVYSKIQDMTKNSNNHKPEHCKPPSLWSVTHMEAEYPAGRILNFAIYTMGTEVVCRLAALAAQ